MNRPQEQLRFPGSLTQRVLEAPHPSLQFSLYFYPNEVKSQTYPGHSKMCRMMRKGQAMVLDYRSAHLLLNVHRDHLSICQTHMH